MSRRWFFAFLAFVAFATPAAAQEKKTINFGIIPVESSLALKQLWEPFLKAMSDATGYEIKAFFASDYAGVIEAMRFKQVDIAWFSNKSGMDAVDRAGGEVFAQAAAANGAPGYYSVLIVHKDSPYQTLDDVLKCDKSIDFGIGDPHSTSGYLVPMTYVFAAKKIDPKQCFKTVRNASHEVNALAVANKQVQLATNNNEGLERLKVTRPEVADKIRVIWTSPLIPNDPIVWRKDLAAEAKAKLFMFFLTYGRLGSDAEVKKAREILRALNWAPLLPSSAAQFYPIREMELNRERLAVEDDSKLTLEEKKAKLDELQAKIDALHKQQQELPRL